MNIHSPVVIALARKNGCSELEALLSLRGSRQEQPQGAALSTVFAYNPDLIVATVKGERRSALL